MIIFLLEIVSEFIVVVDIVTTRNHYILMYTVNERQISVACYRIFHSQNEQ